MRRVEDFGPIYDDEDELVDEDYDPQVKLLHLIIKVKTNNTHLILDEL
jgi:hypothetical protein